MVPVGGRKAERGASAVAFTTPPVSLRSATFPYIGEAFDAVGLRSSPGSPFGGAVSEAD